MAKVYFSLANIQFIYANIFLKPVYFIGRYIRDLFKPFI